MGAEVMFAKVYDPLEIRKNILEAAVALVDMEEAFEAWSQVHQEKERVMGLGMNILDGLNEGVNNFDEELPPLPQGFSREEPRRERMRSGEQRPAFRPVSGDRSELMSELSRIRDRISRMRG